MVSSVASKYCFFPENTIKILFKFANHKFLVHFCAHSSLMALVLPCHLNFVSLECVSCKILEFSVDSTWQHQNSGYFFLVFFFHFMFDVDHVNKLWNRFVCEYLYEWSSKNWKIQECSSWDSDFGSSLVCLSRVCFSLARIPGNH